MIEGSKLLFFDIDGTLAWPGMPASDVTIQALQKAQKNGHKIFLCTGRGESGVAPEIRKIGFDGGLYHVGALAKVDGVCVVDHSIPEETWKQVAAMIDDVVMSYRIDCNTIMYRNRAYDIEELRKEYSLPDGILEVVSGAGSTLLDEYQGEPVYKMICMCAGMEKVEEVRRRLQGIAVVTSYESFTAPDSLIHCDICFGTYSKATAMHAIRQYLGKEVSDCIVFGDGLNDLEVIQAAGTSVAMANADPLILKLADRVCEHCLEDGIAKELDRMGLL